LARGADAGRAAIIRYWHTVEMFSPPGVDKVSRPRRVYQGRSDRPLPWEEEHELQRVRLPPDQTWRHTVYLGIYSLEAVFNVLARFFAIDEESYNDRPSGESAFAAFVVSGDGRPLIGSEVLSSCAWATGRTISPGPGAPDWLWGFDNARNEFSVDFEDLMAADPDDPVAERLRERGHNVGSPLRFDGLAACRALAVQLTTAGNALSHAEIRIKSVPIAKRKAFDTDGHDFLNSFIADDLDRVAGHAATGSIGTALRQYLRPNAELDLSRRVDVQQQLSTVLAHTGPTAIPAGRWPSAPEHPLALGQQLAVNGALQLGTTGDAVFAVNGPPGTGKTTMLRDLIAAIVVQRATALAALAAPKDAFTGVVDRWKTGDYTRVLHRWKPELTGFEIVLASANNGAVENVTNEIPARDAIDECWSDLADELAYFPEIAAALLAVDDQDDDTEENDTEEDESPLDAWALMAARLGNKRNRSRFVDTFWYRKPPEKDGDDADRPTAKELAERGFHLLFKEMEAVGPTTSWAQERTRFTAAAKRVTALRDQRQLAYRTLAAVAPLTRKLADCQASSTDADNRARLSRERAEQAAEHVRSRETTRHQAHQLRAENLKSRPDILERVMSMGRRTREWRDRDDALGAELLAAERALAKARTELNARTDEAAATERDRLALRRSVRAAEAELATARARLNAAEQQLGRQFPDNEWWHDRKRRELTALWTDPEWNQARTELFFAALRLHKAFLHHVPTQMRQSLHAAVDVVAGEGPPELSTETSQLAWQTLFFVVPVVSTTFASFGRLFEQLGQEALGWLLIDEAGQATPQNAVGALWRCQRAVVVGDPLQLEPVITLPFTADQAIRGHHGVDEQWLASRTSVQQLADRLNPLGTYLPTAEGKIWVGSPLTVHRRCDQPMFGISNTVAYDGLMINGTSPKGGQDFLERYPRTKLPETKWIDVVSDVSEGHWIPAEGAQLDIILRALAALDFDMTEVMVIGPFRDIARHVDERSSAYPGLVAGTIHRAQGKQADIVILVLGGDPQREGARRWAASKPNLLNVAVSRAKRRLYVVGNRKAWADKQHFRVLAERLPHDQPRSVRRSGAG
jgi:hypothetical protein